VVIDVEIVELASGQLLEVNRSNYPGYMWVVPLSTGRETEGDEPRRSAPHRDPGARWAKEMAGKRVEIELAGELREMIFVAVRDTSSSCVVTMIDGGEERQVALTEVTYLGTPLDLPPGVLGID